ncbi:MAG: hypothetical protein R3Y39_00635 [Rikenellaceae bacterium]
MDKKLIYNKLSQFAQILAVAIMAITLFSGCSQSFYQPTTLTTDDMYSTHNRDAIIKEQANIEAARAALIEQRKAYWAEELGLQTPTQTQTSLSTGSYSSPYAEKLAMLSASSEYQLPSTYYEMQYDEALNELANYDPSQYNAYLTNDGEVVVESKYINSMYGTWGDPYFNSYAWTYGYPRWSYYSAWGYPRYSWWDYNYNFGWGFGFGYSPYYYGSWWGGYPYFGYNWYRPSYRPPHYGGGGSSRPKSIVRQPNISNSPSSAVGRRNVDGSTVGRSSGSTYNRGGTTRSNSSTTTRSSTQSYSRPSSTSAPSMSRPSTPSGGSSPSRSTNRIGR